MLRIALLFLTAFLMQTSFAQKSYLSINGKVTNENNIRLDSCMIKIKVDGVFRDSVYTGVSGKFKADSLIYGHIYEIHFIKENYSYKFVRIDMTLVDEEEYTLFPVVIDMSLFATNFIPDRKITFLKTEPYAVAAYNPKTKSVEFDLAYIQKMKNKVDEAVK